jgi:hypothetical protein
VSFKTSKIKSTKTSESTKKRLLCDLNQTKTGLIAVLKNIYELFYGFS